MRKLWTDEVPGQVPLRRALTPKAQTPLQTMKL